MCMIFPILYAGAWRGERSVGTLGSGGERRKERREGGGSHLLG